MDNFISTPVENPLTSHCLSMLTFKKCGATLIEILLIIGIFASLLGGVGLSLSRFMDKNYLNHHTEKVTHFLSKSQKNAEMDLKASNWGVYIDDNGGSEGGLYAFFKGNSWMEDPEYNDVQVLPKSLRIQNIQFMTPNDTITFLKNSGSALNTGSFELYNINNPTKIVTISINALGRIQVSE